jgi:hypothetical protein
MVHMYQLDLLVMEKAAEKFASRENESALKQ